MSSAILVVTTGLNLFVPMPIPPPVAVRIVYCVNAAKLPPANTFTEPPVNVALPVTTSLSILVGSGAALIWKVEPGWKVTLPVTFKVLKMPTGFVAPGATTPPFCTLTSPAMLPLPASVPPLNTVTGLRSATLEWFTSPTTNVPLLTVVPRLLAVGLMVASVFHTHPVLSACTSSELKFKKRLLAVP